MYKQTKTKEHQIKNYLDADFDSDELAEELNDPDADLDLEMEEETEEENDELRDCEDDLEVDTEWLNEEDFTPTPDLLTTGAMVHAAHLEVIARSRGGVDRVQTKRAPTANP